MVGTLVGRTLLNRVTHVCNGADCAFLLETGMKYSKKIIAELDMEPGFRCAMLLSRLLIIGRRIRDLVSVFAKPHSVENGTTKAAEPTDIQRYMITQSMELNQCLYSKYLQ